MKTYKATEYYKNVPRGIPSPYADEDIFDMVAHILTSSRNLEKDQMDEYRAVMTNFEDLHRGLLRGLLKRISEHLNESESWKGVGAFSPQEKMTLLAFTSAYEGITKKVFLGTNPFASLMGSSL